VVGATFIAPLIPMEMARSSFTTQIAPDIVTPFTLEPISPPFLPSYGRFPVRSNTCDGWNDAHRSTSVRVDTEDFSLESHFSHTQCAYYCSFVALDYFC
jgi:hypothetical protein